MKVGTVIVGSGVAATAVAQRLLADNPQASVLILEAGVRVKTKDFGLWEQYMLTRQTPYEQYTDLPYPQRDFPGENTSAGGTDMPLNGARVFAYGGSTLHWGGWAFRLKPEDFHLRSNTGEGIDWPFDYDELEPFYCRAEHHLAVSGDSRDPLLKRSRDYPFREFPFTLMDRPIADGLKKLDFDFGHLPIARRGVSGEPSRHAPCQTTGTCKYCPFGARYAACNYLDDFIEWNDWPGLSVRLGAIVDRIITDGKRRVKGVTFWDRETGASQDVEADRVIVAAGTIESAKLLQRSVSDDWRNGLGNNHDLVGRYLVTHPYFTFEGLLPANPLRLQAEMDFPTLVSRHFDSEPQQAAGKYVLVSPPDAVGFRLADSLQKGQSRAEIDAALTGRNGVQIHGMIEVFGRHYNRVTVAKEANGKVKYNRVGIPMTQVEYTKDPDFDQRMKDVEAQVGEILKAMDAPPTGTKSLSWRADHAASVCRMSSREQDGVVDADLRVHGIDNLYVISNAVFPNIGAINPTLTLTALAIRLGDHLNAGGGV
ncbi:GMC family oxidoreductase [Mesorhizobium sp. M0924]|uniref:GMC oxidoreductase n=1 Tax=unclassified Mesorhizobium TaxID=325217 RepID=UPI0003CF7C9B|nr:MULTISPECIES: GMC family oxidoreductase [unclassified Mesorhizobium]ESX46802.1 glucose-methanol-choline oxidoreductase [Mesorhizobium sp. LSHC426A00]ESX56799.1 glucose-methanol-choline oxidoreductase [Mesorhizobium sp. LSHC422A00]ESX58489.1 glucose-methanol-choline oxidoreductase [Mesorhizobium sp. LSHC424B00]ESX71916.1 glucose-methanol-choline oxidoreductase [Mesorhizobium sp. LSHC416B00]ESX78287.1 glucose-methanol-choline oxidoreductase [Mesorhizobium sp. LSHC414A00]